MMDQEIEEAEHTESLGPTEDPDLSSVLITLLKGVIYRDEQERVYATLNRLQFSVRDYVSVLGLELLIDEAEGFAFLKSRTETIESETQKKPRLVARRPLSFHVSLLLALLRKKLAEFDATGGETRLVMSRDEIVDLVRVFIAEVTNETRQMDQWDAHISKAVDLGFLRRLRTREGYSGHFEVRRILKAFVDAQWLSDLDGRLEAYRRHMRGESPTDEGAGDE